VKGFNLTRVELEPRKTGCSFWQVYERNKIVQVLSIISCYEVSEFLTVL